MKTTLVILGLLFISCLSSCSVKSFPHSESMLETCVFDFDKQFPGPRKRPIAVNYDTDRKMLYGKHGAGYSISFGGDIGLKQVFEEDLDMSEKEKRYVECYQNKENQFDVKYAGEIKENLLAVSKRYVSQSGRKGIVYPVYLEGEQLFGKIRTPCSYFSASFISHLAEEKNSENSFRDYILSTELIKDAAIRDLAAGISSKVAGQFRWAYESSFGEYVLTYYYLEKYEDEKTRRRVFEDLATFYSEVAFRSSAEALFSYKHMLNSIQRRKISENYSDRVYKYISQCYSRKFIEDIKKVYQKNIIYECYHNLLDGRYLEITNKSFQNKIRIEEYRHFADELKRRIESGVERCQND
ncbi:hypothetical protein [Desulfopila sp. IMCC35008]|uniref:hypothetical protein n=1 Tax=Desulfopila sp. IMCC35008 TaxID=2653858 RepID=UPI0013D20F49|nr:hypothetical protein [Desulfopila sp. IMCC35008]